MRRRRGLASPQAWLVALVLLALAPASGLAVYVGLEQRRAAGARVEADAGRLARLAASGLTRLVESARDLLSALAEVPELRRGDAAACGALLAGVLRGTPHYVNLGLVGPDGALACSAVPPTARVDLRDRRFVRRAVESRALTAGEYQMERAAGRPAVTFGYPVLGGAGEVRGVVFAALDVARLAQAAAEVPLPERATLTLVDASGTIVARHPEPRRWVGMAMPYAPLVRAMTVRGEGTHEVPGLDGIRRLYAFGQVGDRLGSGLVLAVGVSREAALAESTRLLVVGLVGLTMAGALALGATWVGCRRLDTLVTTMEGEQRAKEALLDEVTDLVARRAQEVALLNQMSGLLQACLTVEEAAAVVGRLGALLFPDEVGALFVVDPAGAPVERVAVWGPAPVEGPPLFAPDDCWAIRRGRPHVVTDTASGLGCPHLGHPAPAACACVPLMAQGQALGVLFLGAASGPAAAPTTLSEARQRLAAAVAEQLALSLANLRLRETLRAQSIRDALTGLFNRRYMEETLERELRRAEREGAPVGVLLVDVDHFKRFNDTHGHEAGDAVLTALGGLLRGSVRAGDIACRHGGEEFVLILPGTSLEEARRRADELREAARDLQVPHRGALLGPVTFSMGIAAFPAHGTTGEALVRAADAALYRAKHAGRDQVALAD